MEKHTFWYFAACVLFVLGICQMLDYNLDNNGIIKGFVMLMLSFIVGIGTYITEVVSPPKKDFQFNEEAFDEYIGFNDYMTKINNNNKTLNVVNFTQKKGAIIKDVKVVEMPINYDILEVKTEPLEIKITQPKQAETSTKSLSFTPKEKKTETLILYENSETLELWIKEAYDAIIKALKENNNDEEIINQILMSIEYVDNYNDTITIIYNSDAIFTFFDKVELSELIRKHLNREDSEKVIITFEKYKYKKIYDYYIEKK